MSCNIAYIMLPVAHSNHFLYAISAMIIHKNSRHPENFTVHDHRYCIAPVRQPV